VDDLEDQYYNRNSIGCSASSLATAGLFCFRTSCPRLAVDFQLVVDL